MENKDKLKNKIVETYTSDMVKAIENDKGGLIKKIIQEEEKHEELDKSLSIRTKKNRLFMSLGVVFIFFGFVILIFLIFFNKDLNIVKVTPQYSSIIFIDQSNFIAVDGFNKDKIAEMVFNQVQNTKVKIGGIEGVYLTQNKTIIGLKNFIKIIKGNLVLNDTDFINDNFLFGIFKNELKETSSISSNLFLLFKVRSLADAFNAIHNWENKMFNDLHGFFGINITSETNYLFTKNFEDSIVENKNARILKDNNGKIVLMYVFINDSSIVITDSESTAHEVILRLTSSKIKK